jgi:gliding motility-associated-like protein
MKNILFLVLSGLIAPLTYINAQSVKRQVISCVGTNHTPITGTNYVSASTIGQTANGSITSGVNCIRQGFQQPPNASDCPINISYDIITQATQNCGTYYTFEYTGNVLGNTTISWDFGPEASPSLATGIMVSNIAFFKSGVQEVLITVADGDCIKTVSTIVNAQPPPYLVLSQVQDALCFGEKGTINLEPSNGTPPYLVKWSNGAVTEDLIGIAPGTYAFTVTDQKGCVDSDVITVIGSNQPLIVEATVLSELCHENNDGSIDVRILNGADPISIIWEDGKEGALRTDLDSGAYRVIIKDGFGCLIDTTFQVTTFCDLAEENFIPDTFSPNGDAANETWDIPILTRFPGHKVQIYNRWGSLLWQAKGDFEGWTGINSSGDALEIGAYYYVIELNDSKKRVYKGSITIVR